MMKTLVCLVAVCAVGSSALAKPRTGPSLLDDAVATFEGAITLDGTTSPVYTPDPTYRNAIFPGNGTWVGTSTDGRLWLGSNTFFGTGSTETAVLGTIPAVRMILNQQGSIPLWIQSTQDPKNNYNGILPAGSAQGFNTVFRISPSTFNGWTVDGPSGYLLTEAGGGANAVEARSDHFLLIGNGPHASDITLRIGLTPYLYVSNAGVEVTTGSFLSKEAGAGNDRSGTCTLSSGTCTVSTTLVSANSHVFVTERGVSGFVGVTARTAGTSFTITSSNSADTSVVDWFIVEPD